MALHPFQNAILHRHIDSLTELTSSDVQLHSPVLHHPIVGRDTVVPLLGELRNCFSGISYTDSLAAPLTLGLIFRATITDLDAEGLQLLRFDADGLIEHITVMLRPLRVAMALSAAMAPKMRRLPDGSYTPVPTPT